MNRRDFLKTSALVSLSGTAAGNLLAADSSTAPSPASVGGITAPVLQNMSESAVTVTWGVSGPATGWVEYGATEALGSIARGEVDGLLPYDGAVLRVRVSGLQAGRKYYYRVQTVGIQEGYPADVQRTALTNGSPIYSFSTLDSNASKASFTVWNDTHEQEAVLKGLIDHLEGHGGDFHLWNGDAFNEVGSEASMVRQILAPASRAYAAGRPLFFVRGNHDVRGSCARALGRVVETPGNRYFYTVRHGPVAVLVLDTGEDKEDSHREYRGLVDFASYRLEQQRWLREAIAQPLFRSAPFRVLFTHIPLRGRNFSQDSAVKWESLLAEARIDFAISGHVHQFAYHEPTAAQPFPLLVGGGPTPQIATFIFAQATSEELSVCALAFDGHKLGAWTVARRS